MNLEFVQVVLGGALVVCDAFALPVGLGAGDAKQLQALETPLDLVSVVSRTEKAVNRLWVHMRPR